MGFPFRQNIEILFLDFLQISQLLWLIRLIYNIFMSDQPIIVQQHQSIKQQQHQQNQQSPSLFFDLLDEVQKYDSLAQQIKNKHDEAMLLFASIKFNNPFALTSSSHRCLPAFLSLNVKQELEQGYGQFTQPIDQEKYPEEYDEQEQIEKECEEKMKNHQLDTNVNSKNNLRERQILYRFNVLNQQAQVVSASNKFRELLDTLVNSISMKRQIEAKFDQYERQLAK